MHVAIQAASLSRSPRGHWPTGRGHVHAVEQTLRSYNAHLSRVQVITYAALLDEAERALVFEDTARTQHARSSSSSADEEIAAAPPHPHSRWEEPPF